MQTAHAAVADLAMVALLRCRHRRGDVGADVCCMCQTLAGCLEWESLFREWTAIATLLLKDADDVLRNARRGGVLLPSVEDVLAVDGDHVEPS